MYALIDCNNFYASCERVFRPDLNGKPVIILSSNDGCVIARSNEAKALGIKMGVPFFQVKGLCKHHRVTVFSSNFSLYGDMSHRVMTTIQAAWPHVEIYSIDEAFLDLSSLPDSVHSSFCENLQRTILKHTGIPTSIGLGHTKTLAKAANYLCKKVFHLPVFDLSQHPTYLKKIEIGEVWGIGRRWQQKLVQQGIHTAYDLSVINPSLLKQQFNVVMMRIALELQGVACDTLTINESKKSIIASRSFGQSQTSLDAISQALSGHCARAWEKLREDRQIAGQLGILLQTHRLQTNIPHTYHCQFGFIVPTDDLRELTQAAKTCLHQLFKPGQAYKKTGVVLNHLLPRQYQQLDLFHCVEAEAAAKKEQLMAVFESINHKYGRQTIRLAAQGFSTQSDPRSGLKSPAYTTKWGELLEVRA